MLSAFFEILYLKIFDGSTLLYPVVNSSVNVAEFRIIRFIFSYAYAVLVVCFLTE